MFKYLLFNGLSIVLTGNNNNSINNNNNNNNAMAFRTRRFKVACTEALQ